MNQSPSIGWWRREAVAEAEPVAAALVPSAVGRPWAFRGLVAFTVILILAPQSFMPALAPLRIALLTAAFVVVAHLADRWGRGVRPPGGVPREVVLTVCLVAWSVVTIPLSMWPGGSTDMLLSTYLKSVIVFWLLGEVVNTTDRLRRLLWTLSALSAPLALTGLRNYAMGSYVGNFGRIMGYGGGLAGNPNDLALVLDLLIPITAMLVLTARHVVARAAGAAILVVSVMGVIVTFSRGGFLALAVEGVLFGLLLARRRAWALIGAAVLLAALAMPLLPASYGARLATITSISADPTGSSQTRWRDTLAALRYLQAHPILGAGLGNEVLALNETRGATWTLVHDAYLDYAVDLGVVGLLLYAALVVSSIWTARTVERDPLGKTPPGRELSGLASGVRISLIAFAAAAFFYPVAYHFYFYYFAGLAVALRTCRAGLAADRSAT